MARKPSDGPEFSAFEAPLGGFMRLGARQLEAWMDAQSSFTQQAQAMGETWIKRWQQEGALASDVAAKLTAARSIPDATAAWQHWLEQHLTWATEDAQRMVDQAQTLVGAGTRAIASSWTEMRRDVAS